MIEFKDLGFSATFQRKIDFFPEPICCGVSLGVWGEENSTPIEILSGMLIDYEIDLGVLFTEEKISILLVEDENRITVFEKSIEKFKNYELEELILASGLHEVVIAEEVYEYDQFGLKIISNVQVETEEGEE